MLHVVIIQEFLFALSDKNPNHIQVKRDFLLGLNGAPIMTVANLSAIETFHRLITSGRRAESPTDFFMFLNSPVSAWLHIAQTSKLIQLIDYYRR